MTKTLHLSSNLNAKLNHLIKIISNLNSVCVAFSGGVDSTLLLKVAVIIHGANVLAITVNGPMLPDSEFKESQKLANDIGITPIVISADLLSLENFVANSKDRCYHCKKYIFTQIKSTALSHHYSLILDGSNLDDLNDYRPGIQALNELKIISPLKEANLTKQEIRQLSAYYGLPTATKPAMACLATRIPTGTPITQASLKTIESCEDYLKSLGLTQYRLRLFGTTGKIECDLNDFDVIFRNRCNLVQAFKQFGLQTTTLDLAGYSCGNMNFSSK
jgi:uncharacterized protein